MKDRFDIESEISQLNTFSDMLNGLSASILDDKLSKDQISTALDGLAIMIECHSNKMMDTLCQVFRLNNYKNIDT